MNFFWNLNERERWVLGIGVVLSVLYFFYMVVYAPLTDKLAKQKQQLSIKQETLTWMQKARQQYQPKKATESVSRAKLLSILGTALNETSFKSFPFQLQQTGAEDIHLGFDNVPYQPFLTWLKKISTTYAVSIKQLTIQPANEPGVVKLRLVLSTH